MLVSHFNLEMLLFLNLKFQELSVLGEVDLFFFSLLSVTSSRDLKRRNSQLQLNIFHLIFVPILSGRTVTLPFPTVAQTKSFLCWSPEAGMLLLFLTILTIFWGLSLTSSKSLKLFIVSNSFWDWLFILSKSSFKFCKISRIFRASLLVLEGFLTISNWKDFSIGCVSTLKSSTKGLSRLEARVNLFEDSISTGTSWTPKIDRFKSKLFSDRVKC